MYTQGKQQNKTLNNITSTTFTIGTQTAEVGSCNHSRGKKVSKNQV